jgi:hypothetical protein
MLRVLQLEEIERKLLEVSTLIDSQNNQISNFIDSVEIWLIDIDEILQKNRLSISGSISGLRGTLLSVRSGVSYQDINFTGRLTHRKRIDSAAIDIINRAVEIVESSIQGDRTRINEAERIALQLLSIARTNGWIIEDPNAQNESQFAQSLINLMRSNKATVQGIVHLEGLLGQSDTVIVIDRLLDYG